MKLLTSSQFERLTNALVQAFSRQGLLQLVYLYFPENTAPMCAEENLTDNVSAMLRWSEDSGLTLDLIRRAHHDNPGNPELVEFLIILRGEHSDPVVRYESAVMLGESGTPHAQRALEDAAKHETDLYARLGIIDGLKTVGYHGPIPSLVLQ